jgi:serine/threonine-protein kinase
MELLGLGGFSRVYKVERQGGAGFRRFFALKVLAPEIEVTEDLRAMLADEARIGRHLHHRNIAAVHEFGEADHRYFLVLDWVDGLDLGTLLRRLREESSWLPLPVILEVAVQILHGLHHAHTRVGAGALPLGIVHRDLTPGNVLVSMDGCVKITDFGLARIRDKIAVTQAGITRGTCRYMSPEQATGKPLDGRSDIFAVGILLYTMLAQKAPFTGRNDSEVMMAVAQGRFVPLRTHAPDVPPEVERIVHWMMRPKREDRPLDALAAAEVITGRIDPAWAARPQRTLAALVRRATGG